MKHSTSPSTSYVGLRLGLGNSPPSACSAVVAEGPADSPAAWNSAVDAAATQMTMFADGSPLGMILDVLAEHPDLKIRILQLLNARIQSATAGEVRDEECA